MFTYRLVKIWCTASLVLLCLAGKAQEMEIVFKDGSSTSYALSQLLRFTYENDQMNLLQNDGISMSIPLSIIEKITFLQTVVNARPPVFSSSGLKLYPNPVSNVLQMEFPESANEDRILEVADFFGRVWYSGRLKGIEKIFSWPIPDDLQSGAYICRLYSDGSSVESAVFIIQK